MKSIYIPSKFLKLTLELLKQETAVIEESDIDYPTLMVFIEAKSEEKDGLVFFVDSCFGFKWDFPTDEALESVDDDLTIHDFVKYAKEHFPIENNKSDLKAFLKELHWFIGVYLDKMK